METEAMRIAKEWADSTGNMGFICRAFLAQQARLAEVEREAFVAGAVFGYGKSHVPHMMPGNWHAEAICRYPAPSAHAGEARPVASTTLCACGHSSYDHYGYDTGKRWCMADGMRCACDDFRPAPTPEPEPLVLVVEYQGPLGDWRGDAYRTRVRITPDIAKRIVALAQEAK